MVPKTAQEAASAASPAPPVVVPRSCRALVISRDPVERQAVVLRLGSAPEVEPSSAAGFHMAVPMIWQEAPDALVIGRLTEDDIRRLPELRAQASRAVVLLLPSADPAASVLQPGARLSVGADPLEALAATLGGPERG